jgi:hypothetical protein
VADVLILSVSASPDRLGRLDAALSEHGLSTATERLSGTTLTKAQRKSIVRTPMVLLLLARDDGDGAGAQDAAAALAFREGGLAVVPLTPDTTVAAAGTAPRFDLSAWRGSSSNATLAALVRQCQAIVVSRRPLVAQRGLKRWLLRGSLGGMVALGFSVTGIDLFNVQQQLCGFPGPQPWLSDVCGTVGVGDRPTRAERLAWETRRPGDCSALIAHIRRFPDGKLVPQAHALYAARTPQSVGRVAHVETIPLQVSITLSGPTDRAATLARGHSQAGELCSMYAHDQNFTVSKSVAVPTEWHCDVNGCSFRGKAKCTLFKDEVREICPIQNPSAS